MGAHSTRRARARQAVLFALQTAFFFGAWWAFVGQLSVAETVVGVGAALASAIASTIVGAQNVVAFRGRIGWVDQIWRVPKYALLDTAQLFAVLARHLFTRNKAPSLVRAVPFDVGDDRDPSSHARRALAITYSNLTPSMVVLGVDLQHKRLVFHQLAKSPVPKMTRNLGAMP